MRTLTVIAPYVAAIISAVAISDGFLSGSVAGCLGIYSGLVAIIFAISFK